MANNSTITLLDSMEWVKKFVYNRPLSLDSFKEPIKTAANIIKQTILGPPFGWRWNNVVTGFVCTAGVQDYKLGNWSANAAFSSAFRIIDTNGNSQRVSVAGTSGGLAPSWNGTTTGTTVDGSVTWVNDGAIANSSSNYTFGWIDVASVQDIAPTAPKWYEMEPKISLGLESSQARPTKIAAQFDNGHGAITFRAMPVPDRSYPISLTIQEKSSLFTSLNGTWDPIPDEYSYIYQTGLLALIFMYADDPRFSVMNQKFVAHLLGANQGLTDTERNIFLNNWFAQSGQAFSNQINLQQGNQARNLL